MTNSGAAIKLSDGRSVIVYNDQPLLKKGKVVLNIVDEQLNICLGEKGRPKTILKSVEDYNKELERATLIGFLD